MCLRLVLIPRSVGTATLFLDFVPVNLATLKEHCLKKGISLKNPGIPTLAGKIGIGSMSTRQNGLIIQMVGEDRKFGWGMIPTMIAMGR